MHAHNMSRLFYKNADSLWRNILCYLQKRISSSRIINSINYWLFVRLKTKLNAFIFFFKVYFVSNVSHARFPIEPSKFKTIDGTGDCGIHYSKNEEWIRIESEKLLRNYCPICGYEFESFDILRDHVRRQHKLLYCDLCVEHLNLFPYERKVYNRQDLVQHIRSGDRDDKSFKGHPACKFCNDHFLDNDHLYRHMRQEHYYCHLCTSDNVYYRFVQ